MNHRDRPRRAYRLLAATAAALLVTAACGGDDDDAADSTSADTEAVDTTSPGTDADTGDTTTPDSGDTTPPGTDGSSVPATGASTVPGDSTAPDSALLAEAQENGITIGIANERPYGYADGDEATGEAPELAKAIFERMGIEEVDFEVVDFGALINGLNAGRYDVIAAGMFINAERAEQVAFADPDYCGTTAFGVPEGNPEGLTDFQSVIDADVELGVMAGAVEEGYALDSGVPEDNISAFQTTPDLFDALAAGRIDAAALTAITVRAQVADYDGLEATEGFVPVINGVEQLGCGAFAFRYENQAFRDEFNRILHEMQENNEILPIIEEFGFTEAEVDAAVGVTVEDLTSS